MKDFSNIQTIIMAGGKGTRMKSAKSKVLFRIGGLTMLEHSIRLSQQVIPNTPLVTIPSQSKTIKKVCRQLQVNTSLETINQGTGWALKMAMSQVPVSTAHMLIYNADDSSLYTPQAIIKLITHHLTANADATMMVIKSPVYFPGLKKVICDSDNNFLFFSNPEHPSGYIHTGCQIFKKSWTEKLIPDLTPDPVNHEYQIIQLFELGVVNQDKIIIYLLTDQNQWWSVNTQNDLKIARRMWKRQQAIVSTTSSNYFLNH